MLRKTFRLLPPKFQVPILALRSYYFGEPEIRLLKELVDPTKNSIDIGGAKGIYTYFLARHSQHVFTYEPNPISFRFITASFASNVTIRQIALSDTVGEATLQIPIIDGRENFYQGSLSKSFSSTARVFSVKKSRLDDESHGEIGFIKIDVEGHERQVIEGGKRLLTEQRPNLLVEIEQRHLDVDMEVVFKCIKDLGYEGFFLQKGKLVALDHFKREEFQDSTSDVNLSKYVNNFIFKPC